MKRWLLLALIVGLVVPAGCRDVNVMQHVNQISEQAAKLHEAGVLSELQTAAIMVQVAVAHDLGRDIVQRYEDWKGQQTPESRQLIRERLAQLMSVLTGITVPTDARARPLAQSVASAVHEVEAAMKKVEKE